MDEFKARQLAQMRFAIADFREEKISLNMLLSRLEGAARAVGQEFWEQNVYDRALELEQINADLLEERRALTPSEQMQVETLIARLESQLSQVD
jgi:single-stranded DNA-specific DHH superfamily exonuclease